MIFDFRVYLGNSFDGTKQSVEQLLSSMDALEIDMALAFPFRPLSCDLEQANTALSAAIKGYPDRLLGAARIDPWQPDAVDTLRRGIESLGLRALFLNPWEETFRIDVDRLDPLMEISKTNNLPVVIAAGYPWLSEALQVAKLAARWPDASIVMTNGGQINISGLGQADATLALSRNPNLFMDTAGIYRQDFIEETIDAFGSERVLFGSGSPYFDQRYEIKRVLLAKAIESDRSAMKSGNARRLLKIAA